MNPKIMRRGLSPEGQRFRKQQQGSLLNSELGVCSTQNIKKPPRDFLRENLELLRIKSASNKSSARSSRAPIKALPEAAKDSLFGILQNSTDKGTRHGSAHSDYFSLPDESLKNEPTDSTYIITPKIDTHMNSPKSIQDIPDVKETDSLYPSPCPIQQNPQTLHKTVELYEKLQHLRQQKPSCEVPIDEICAMLMRQHKLLLSGKLIRKNDPKTIKASNNLPMKPKEIRTKKRVDSATQTLPETSYHEEEENLQPELSTPPESSFGELEEESPELLAQRPRELTFNKRCSSLDTLNVPPEIGKSKDLHVPRIIETNSSEISYNAKSSNKTSMCRSKSTTHLENKLDTPASHRFGQVPKYLLARKARLQKEKESAEAIDPLCPPGHTLLPEQERTHTLELLFKGQDQMISEISRLPLAKDTLRLRKKRAELESILKNIEEGIQIFSQNKVYVMNDE